MTGWNPQEPTLLMGAIAGAILRLKLDLSPMIHELELLVDSNGDYTNVLRITTSAATYHLSLEQT